MSNTIRDTIGEPFEGEVHSTNASSGVAVPIYNPGKPTARVLASNEYLVVTHAQLVVAAGGDAYILIGADATLGTNEVVTRGTFAVNGGTSGQLERPKTGLPGNTLWVVAPSGVVDVQVKGYIRKVDNAGTRPSWRESQVLGA